MTEEAPKKKCCGWFSKILIALVVLIGGFVALVALQPGEFKVVRSATMSAPPSDVFAQINDFHKWDAWSPWAKRDPAVVNTFEGAASGQGAIFRWAGNSKVGKGSMTILESRPGELIKIKLEFTEPMQAASTTEFVFKAEGNQTTVTWSMYGENNFIAKAFCLFMNMDKTVGGDFEKGLAQIKSVVEKK